MEAAGAIWNYSLTRFGRINPNKPDAGNCKVGSTFGMQRGPASVQTHLLHLCFLF